MKKLFFFLLICNSIFSVSCKKNQNSSVQQPQTISPEILQKIKSLGYSNKNVLSFDSGYIVEGDIYVSKAELDLKPDRTFLRIANVEQYRTTNLVTGLPRTISITPTGLPSHYTAALDIAIQRFNALNLLITFERRTSACFTGGCIIMGEAEGNPEFLGLAGTPGSSGNPYRFIFMNSERINSSNVNYIASVMAHEIGHCIGFRHTDYTDRSFSCGGDPENEGSGSSGAIHIPGTPAGPDFFSWMLACIGHEENRPFNVNDIVALQFLY